MYVLDVRNLTQLNGRDLPAGGITLGPGVTYTLPEGKGSISFAGLKRYIGADIRATPGQGGVLAFFLLAVAGMASSLHQPSPCVGADRHPPGRTHHD